MTMHNARRFSLVLFASAAMAAPAPTPTPPPKPVPVPPMGAPKPSKAAVETMMQKWLDVHSMVVTVPSNEVKADEEIEIKIAPNPDVKKPVDPSRISLIFVDGPKILTSAEASRVSPKSKEWKAKIRIPKESASGTPTLVVTIYKGGAPLYSLRTGPDIVPLKFGKLKQQTAAGSDSFEAQDSFDAKTRRSQIKASFRFASDKEDFKQAIVQFFDGARSVANAPLTCRREDNRLYRCEGGIAWPAKVADSASLHVSIYSTQSRTLEKVLPQEKR